MEPSFDPDYALVAACQQGLGAEDPFRALHDRHRAFVHHICLRITGDACEALDATQDAFLLAFRGIRAFRFRSRFSSWLGRIAAHASFERLRKLNPSFTFSDLGAPEFGGRRRADPPTFLEECERRIKVRRALRRLSPHLREILVLRYYEELSYQELTSRLGIARGSVCSRLHRAHEALSERLRATLPEVELESIA
jgi:RNA polymerase sigma-70 factor, ECF subfamily